MNRFTKIVALAAMLALLGVGSAHAAKTLYSDTLSVGGRAVDSTAFQATNPGQEVTVGFNLTGNATAGNNRIGVTIRWHAGVGTVDSTWTWTVLNPTMATTKANHQYSIPDSIVQTDAQSAVAMGPHEMTLVFNSTHTYSQAWPGRWIPFTFRVPPGVQGYSIKFRIWSQSSTEATGPSRFTIVRA